MNKILNQLIKEQTPEQVQKAFAKIKQVRGYCSDDISVENALGISTDFNIDFQYVDVKNLEINTIILGTVNREMSEISYSLVVAKGVQNINIPKALSYHSEDIFNQVAVNDATYSLAA